MRFRHRIRLAGLSPVWLCAAVAAWATHGSSQSLVNNASPTQQMMSTRSAGVEKDIELGNAFLYGHGAPKDEKQAAYWFEKAADAGDPWAQQQIGFFYQAGIGVPVDEARSTHWYQLAAANGLAGAKMNLGVAYLWGLGVPVDKGFAAQLFRRAADQGNGTAASYLGNLYFFGQGLPQDRAAAEHWYRVGAKLHDPVAEYDLGMLYSVEDHEHDYSQAAAWLRKSVAGGYVPAMHSLALLLEEHTELAKSAGECLTLFEKASAYGQWKSSEALGIIYRDGTLAPRDAKAAYSWFRLALLQGAQPAQLTPALEQLTAELGADEAAKLDAAAQAWRQQHPAAVEFLLKRSMKITPPGLAIMTPAEGRHAGQLISVPPA